MDLLQELAITVFTSAVSRVRDSVVVQNISTRTMSSPEVFWPVPMRAIGAQNLLTMPGGVSIAGYLHKKGGSQFSLRKWPLRYTILHKGCMYYFKSSTSPSPQGAFSLNGYNRVMRAAEETTSSNVFPFKIVHFSKKHRTWFFSAASENERRKWMQFLRREIDHYNDRNESNTILSGSDSDEDSFYGTIERPMDIKHPVDTEDEYCEEDDEDDEEDYLEPDNDSSPTCTGHPIGPPPSYPPPPVPAASHHHHDSSPVSNKAPPSPGPPLHRNPTSPLPRKPPPAIPLPPVLKDRPQRLSPPGPFVPHPQISVSSTPPPPPPPNTKPVKGRWPCTEGQNKTDWRSPPAVLIQSASTLPICDHLETSMALNGPTLSPSNSGGSQSLDSYHQRVTATHRIRPCQTPLHSTNTEASSQRRVMSDSLSLSEIPIGHLPLHSTPQGPPVNKSRPYNIPEIPRPPPPSAKPQLAATKIKNPGVPPQSSPDGQSFRSLGGKMSSKHPRRPTLSPCGGGDESDDYENMQLPDSVFIDTTETSVVERLFKQGPLPPQDGLYGIRNSGTRTSRVLVVWDVSISKARNYRLFEEDGLIFLDSEVTFPSLADLIEHYYCHPLPHHGSLCLQKPFINLLTNTAR
ncbi:SH3 domain-binding protein 2 isoform X3 [Takifugu flavidus]|uniref:SH3 domain-binding protein 2 isoform X3 n=1 Tax=Takifugu flavidus TaxID=433684 RepID=UPI002544A959|nr:SH3 domain-binding protein 2 isoform X3 [Takifugu flavidus]